MVHIRADQVPLVLMLIIALTGIVLFWSVMDMVLLGASLAVILIPLHHRISHRVPHLASAIIVILGIMAISVLIIGGTLLAFDSGSAVMTQMFSTIGTWLATSSTNPEIQGITFNKTLLTGLFATGKSLFVNFEQTIVDNLTFILFKAFIFFFTLFMLILHGEELYRRIRQRMPDRIRQRVDRLSGVTADTLYAIYVVQVAIAVLTFFISIPVFLLLGYGDVLFYSFFAAFCELVPVLGSSIAFLLVGTYALATGDIPGVIILFILGYLVVSCLPEIFIRPVLVGRRVKISPVVMFVGIIGGLLTMGLAGFVLGPVIVVLLITSYRMYVEEQKEIPDTGITGKTKCEIPPEGEKEIVIPESDERY